MEEITKEHQNVDVVWLPKPYWYDLYSDWILWADGCDDEGNFLGHCPLHDANKEHEGSAMFNFFKGIMRCKGDPRCTTGRAISLVNLTVKTNGPR